MVAVESVAPQMYFRGERGTSGAGSGREREGSGRERAEEETRGGERREKGGEEGRTFPGLLRNGGENTGNERRRGGGRRSGRKKRLKSALRVRKFVRFSGRRGAPSVAAPDPELHSLLDS